MFFKFILNFTHYLFPPLLKRAILENGNLAVEFLGLFYKDSSRTSMDSERICDCELKFFHCFLSFSLGIDLSGISLDTKLPDNYKYYTTFFSCEKAIVINMYNFLIFLFSISSKYTKAAPQVFCGAVIADNCADLFSFHRSGDRPASLPVFTASVITRHPCQASHRCSRQSW